MRHGPALLSLGPLLAKRLAVLTVSLGCMASVAQPQDHGHVLYRVQPGDTLLSLTARFTKGPDALAQIVQANRLRNPDLIPVGFSLRIPKHLIRHEASAATVSLLNCRSVARVDVDPAVTVQTGDQMLEGHAVRIPAGCQMSLLLEDQSVIRLMSGAVIKLGTLRRNLLEASPEVRVELLDGRLEVDVPRKREKGDAPFDVRTPASIAGVRGTEFRVVFDAAKGGSQVEVLDGVVAARGLADADAQQAHAGQGVAILPDGRALPVENLLNPPVFTQGQARPGSAQWLLEFRAPEQAREFLVRSSNDAGFRVLSREEKLSAPSALLDNIGAQAVFQQWSSVSSTGLMGRSVNYGFCKGYRLQEMWRCNVVFAIHDMQLPRLQLRKIESDQEQLILDQDIRPAGHEWLVFRGLPAGLYRWQIEHSQGKAGVQRQSGQFQLVALPGPQ